MMTGFDAEAADQIFGVSDGGKPAPVSFDTAAADEVLAADVRTLLAFSAREAAGKSPDQVAHAACLSRSTGSPIDAAMADTSWFKTMGIGRLFRSAPEANRAFLSNPVSAALAESDLERVIELERTWGEFERTWGVMTQRERPEPSFRSVFKGLQDAAALKGMGASLDLIIHDLIFGKDDSVERRHLENKVDLAQSEIDISTPEFESDTAQAIYLGATGLAQQMSAFAVGAATGNPIAFMAMTGGITAVPAYGKYSSRGGSGTEAALGAVGEGATEILTERIPMGFLVSKFEKAGAGKSLSELLGYEIPREQVKRVILDAIDTAIANPDKTWGEYLKERLSAAYQTLVATITQVGTLRMLNASQRKIIEQRSSTQDTR